MKAREEMFEDEVLEALKQVWLSKVSSKIKIFSLRILLDKIPTRE